jgi:hypothetical protein
MRVRLRPAYSEAALAVLYAVPHQHAGWPDHRVRVAETIGLAREMGVPPVVADLSCGDAAIGRALMPPAPACRLILGDIAPGYELHGPIEQTLDQITHVGMFICAETIEHLDDPDAVLARIRLRADSLVLSTPLGEFTDRNPEHYWGWDAEEVKEMLLAASWKPELYREVICAPAAYQLWGCR